MTHARHPLLVATGFVALDRIFSPDGKPAFSALGGSSGNVLANAAALGARTLGLYRIGADVPGRQVRVEMEGLGCDVSMVRADPGIVTPVIEHLVAREDGGAPGHHEFRRVDPLTGTSLGRWSSIEASDVERLIRYAVPPQVMYFDRVSAPILHAATWAREQGTLIIFEPSAIRDPDLFRQAMELAHIVKISAERMAEIVAGALPPASTMIITLGARGLQFRLSPDDDWISLPAVDARSVIDTAGAGDMVTAALIWQILDHGWQVDGSVLSGTLRLGQELAALNCEYIGARGLIHALGADPFRALAQRLRSAGTTHLASST
ncbi:MULTISPECIES: PfkB family carbohydrate kinase [Microvirga]|uniref:PfkB family carbohydrate kinase n=1 Tax=Microvirga TaxID=186650 RepID=UPI0021C6A1E1|nr:MULTISPECIES: PfkB family carbohydrate kinase [unclassified Microvirga]